MEDAPLKPHEAAIKLREELVIAMWELELLANAFETTGNKSVADKLDLIISRLAPLHPMVSRAMDADFDQQMAHSNAMHHNILNLVLGGHLSISNSSE